MKLNLKCTCFKNNICKVGIPVNVIDKYIEKLNKIKYAYIIYDYNRQSNSLEEKYKREGKANKITNENVNCLMCKGVSKYKDDEYMQSMYNMLEKTFYLNKINRKENIKESFDLLNKIDVELNCQRIYLRIMKNEAWIDKQKFNVAMQKIYELGKIIGGLTNAYAKNN